jgi:hypothetical protein
MLIKKILASSVDLFAHQDIYSLNIADTLLKKITARFVNICYSNMLILRVVRLIEHSDVLMVDDRLDGGASCDVRFEVEGLQMSADEVLNGCRVVDITSTGILFDSQYADGLIMTQSAGQLAGIIKKNMVIPVTVVSASYPINHNKLTITGTLFSPKPANWPVYKITESASEREMSMLQELVAKLAEEAAQHSNTQSFIGANKITYPYVQPKPVSGARVDFSLTQPDLPGMLALSDCVTMPQPFVNEFKFSVISGKLADAVEASQFVAWSDFINRRLIYLQTVRGIAQQYNTPDKWTALKDYWQIIMHEKQKKI